MHLSFRSFRLAAVLAAATLGLSLSAHAGTIPFNVQIDILGDGSQLTGSMVENLTSGDMTGTFTFSDGVNTYVFAGSGHVADGETAPDGNYNYVVFANGNGDELDLSYLPIETDTGPLTFTEPLCSLAAPCDFLGTPAYANVVPSGGAAINVADGYLLLTAVPISATPEPSSFALLGTGLLGIAGVARRRFLHS